MVVTAWFIILGVLLIGMALAGSVLKRLPLSAAMLYLGAGVLLGPAALGLIRIDPITDAALLEHVTEAVVIVSLFTAGLKLRTPLSHGRWRPPVRLATVSMLITVALVALAGVTLLGLPLGAAVLLGAILAPTDPVLAADVQVENASDRDRVRFSLTGEAGLNDGTAFPFVMLGLGLLGLHGLGAGGWRWPVVDVGWAAAGGLLIGGLLGTLIGRLVLYLRREYAEAVGLDDFLALGLIALAYGLALLAHTYGFLAVFAAGVALRRVELQASGEEADADAVADAAEGGAERAATNRETAPAYMARAVLGFNEKVERIAELGVVLLLGGMLTSRYFTWEAVWFVPLLLLVIRPLAVTVGLAGTRTAPLQRRLMCWFGIRGIGSLYYLAFALHQGVAPGVARELAALTLTTVTASIIMHGISVTPLMQFYSRRQRAAEHPGSEHDPQRQAAGTP
jgi:NhaP-type Na+/H+ or K+/H+ antiporter